MTASTSNTIQVAAIGAGEYTTGFTTNAAKSDKKIGVVGLTLFDLRRRGEGVGKISIAGVSDNKWDKVVDHFKTNIEAVYKDMDTTFSPYPAPGTGKDPEA